MTQQDEPLSERLLPQNDEAERGVLGSIEIDPACFADVVSLGLRAEDFKSPAHQVIFAAMDALWRDRKTADLITLTDELTRRGRLEEAGGVAYVSSLSNQVPTSANVVEYAEIVARTALARRVIHAAGQIAGLAYHDPDSDELAHDAQRLLTEALTRRMGADSVTFTEAAQSLIAENVRVMEEGGVAPGVRYGLSELDRVLLGMRPGELVYLCGRPGAGKSSLAAAIAERVADECAARGEGSVEYLTFEMRAEQVVGRMIAAHANVNTHSLRANFLRRDGSIDHEAWGATRDAALSLMRQRGDRLRLMSRRLRIADIRLHLERAIAQRDCRFAVLDYIGLISPDDDRAARMAEIQRISNLSRELKQLALNLGIPILCLVQMSRASEGRPNPRPLMTDLRDSGQLEQDADAILGVVRMASYLPRLASAQPRFAQFAETHILKARDGAQAGAVVPLRFEPAFTRFSDWPGEWRYDDYLTLMPSDDGNAGSDQGGARQSSEEEWR